MHRSHFGSRYTYGLMRQRKPSSLFCEMPAGCFAAHLQAKAGNANEGRQINVLALAALWAIQQCTHRGARTHDHRVKSLAL